MWTEITAQAAGMTEGGLTAEDAHKENNDCLDTCRYSSLEKMQNHLNPQAVLTETGRDQGPGGSERTESQRRRTRHRAAAMLDLTANFGNFGLLSSRFAWKSAFY